MASSITAATLLKTTTPDTTKTIRFRRDFLGCPARSLERTRSALSFDIEFVHAAATPYWALRPRILAKIEDVHEAVSATSYVWRCPTSSASTSSSGRQSSGGPRGRTMNLEKPTSRKRSI